MIWTLRRAPACLIILDFAFNTTRKSENAEIQRSFEDGLPHLLDPDEVENKTAVEGAMRF